MNRSSEAEEKKAMNPERMNPDFLCQGVSQTSQRTLGMAEIYEKERQNGPSIGEVPNGLEQDRLVDGL